MNDLKILSSAVSVGNLECYTSWAYQVPMLSQEEETRLACAWSEHQDVDAARQLVLAHLRFVIKIARSYAGYGLAQSDLIQEGNIGLMKAVKRFDPHAGVRLVSFAIHWIKAEINEFVVKNWRIVKIATTKAQRKLFFKLRSTKERLGQLIRPKDVADELEVSEKTVLQMEERLNARDASFEVSDEDDPSYAPAQYLTSDLACVTDPARLIECENTESNGHDVLQLALSSLDERSRNIVCSRWLAEKKINLERIV